MNKEGSAALIHEERTSLPDESNKDKKRKKERKRKREKETDTDVPEDTARALTRRKIEDDTALTDASSEVLVDLFF
jgi:hypothetical protein